MSAWMTWNLIAVAVNALLLLTLLVLYLRIWREVPSGFTLGLAFFAGVLLFQNAVQVYFFATMMRYYAGGVEALVLVQNVLATVALAVLVAVTWAPAGSRRGIARPEPDGTT